MTVDIPTLWVLMLLSYAGGTLWVLPFTVRHNPFSRKD